MPKSWVDHKYELGCAPSKYSLVERKWKFWRWQKACNVKLYWPKHIYVVFCFLHCSKQSAHHYSLLPSFTFVPWNKTQLQNIHKKHSSMVIAISPSKEVWGLNQHNYQSVRRRSAEEDSGNTSIYSWTCWTTSNELSRHLLLLFCQWLGISTTLRERGL